MLNRYALPMLAALLAAAGCSGGGTESAGTPTATPTPSASSTSPSPSPTPSSTPLPTTEQEPGAPLKARNGTKLRTCHDGKCEVVVRQGDVLRFDRKLKVDRLTVAGVSGKRMTLDVAYPSGGGATISFAPGAGGGSNGIQYVATAVKGKRAVLYIYPAKD